MMGFQPSVDPWLEPGDVESVLPHGLEPARFPSRRTRSAGSASRWTNDDAVNRTVNSLLDFLDTAHFSRAFKQEFGVPPTAVTPGRGQR